MLCALMLRVLSGKSIGTYTMNRTQLSVWNLDERTTGLDTVAP
jgi:hypothetical protein